jgi:hypothetical protein
MRVSAAIAISVVFLCVLIAYVATSIPGKPPSVSIGPGENEVLLALEHQALAKFVSKLKQLAGETAKECGIAPLPTDSASVLSCGAESLSHNKPFWLAIEISGSAPYVWKGFSQSTTGSVFEVDFQWISPRLLDSRTKMKLCGQPAIEVNHAHSDLSIRCEEVPSPTGPVP